ncbi:MAG: AmmeMemoRadiSam system protein B [Sumerlaeia bacterium]
MAPFTSYPLETPALRHLEIIPTEHEGQPLLLVRDPLGLMEGEMAALYPDPLLLVFFQYANGKTTLKQMAVKATHATGHIITEDQMLQIAKQLDDALMLLSPKFEEAWDRQKEDYASLTARKPTVFRSEDRLLLLKQLGDEFRRHKMSAKSPPAKLDLAPNSLRAILAPHIDYMRGGEAYAWAYKAVAEHSQATTFVILGTLHRPCGHPFIATRKAYETPLGTAEVDREALDFLENKFGGELYDEEYLHAQEHTIELQVVYLQHVLQNRPFKIVPILVGSFEELLMVDPPMQPTDVPEIAQFIEALKATMAHLGKRGLLIGGVDFSHCGPEFGDEVKNTPQREEEVRERDTVMLKHIDTLDAKGFFDFFRGDFNETKVCSIAPIYCLLQALAPDTEGKTLIYSQSNDPQRDCMVTFAGVAFTAKAPKIILT